MGIGLGSGRTLVGSGIKVLEALEMAAGTAHQALGGQFDPLLGIVEDLADDPCLAIRSQDGHGPVGIGGVDHRA